MESLSPEQKLEIARRVDETFDTAERWHRGGWGRDDDGYPLSFDGGFHVKDQNGIRHTPALRMRLPDAQRRFCLAAAIRIHTAAVAGCDPTSPAASSNASAKSTSASVGSTTTGVAATPSSPISTPSSSGTTAPTVPSGNPGLARAVVARLDAARFGPA